MHELSIARSVVDAVEQARAEKSLGPISLVRLRIGRMSGVLPDALRFCWDTATQDTGLAGAVLAVVVTEPQYRCRECNATAPFESEADRCPDCGAIALGLDGGTDLVIDSVETAE